MDSESLLNMPLDDVVKKLSGGKGDRNRKGGSKGKGRSRGGKAEEAKGAAEAPKKAISKMDMPLDSLLKDNNKGRGKKGRRNRGAPRDGATKGAITGRGIIGIPAAKSSKGRAQTKGQGKGRNALKRVIPTAAKLQNAGPRRFNMPSRREPLGIRESRIVGSQSIQQKGPARRGRFDNWKAGPQQLSVRPAKRFNFSSQRRPIALPVGRSVVVKKSFTKQAQQGRREAVQRRPLPPARNQGWQSPKQQPVKSTWGPPPNPRARKAEGRQQQQQQQQVIQTHPRSNFRAQQQQTPAPARNNYQSSSGAANSRTAGRGSNQQNSGNSASQSNWSRGGAQQSQRPIGKVAEAQSHNTFESRGGGGKNSSKNRFSGKAAADRFQEKPQAQTRTKGGGQSQPSFYSHDSGRWANERSSESGKNQRSNFRRDDSSRAGFADRSNMKQISTKASSSYPTVKVTNIPQEYSRNDILGAFKDHFDVQDVIMKNRGMALVLFKNANEARLAKEQFDGGEMNDHKIRVIEI